MNPIKLLIKDLAEKHGRRAGKPAADYAGSG